LGLACATVDFVASSEHVVGRRFGLVARLLGAAVHRRVAAVGAEAVAPAIIKAGKRRWRRRRRRPLMVPVGGC
jgi:hypothetical protein